jgi:hypothetical protein
LRATSAAPRRFAANGDSCLYSVPMRARSASSSTGSDSAPGTWSCAYSAGERASMIASNDVRIDGCMATECDGAFIG